MESNGLETQIEAHLLRAVDEHVPFSSLLIEVSPSVREVPLLPPGSDLPRIGGEVGSNDVPLC